ncbi:MAG: DNA topoisomerase I [Candidatus Omnitrophica bacterium 4484_70.1]|nr:MAG: DNA topoisomerase I [Candidatus Omnitrophica bacterium 4484_70.1]
MRRYLVVVESPTKAKTISQILGRDYEVLASRGHILDLPAYRLAVKVNDGFIPFYQVIPEKREIVKILKEKAKKKKIIYLATDPDREGEAIAFHIKKKLSSKDKKFFRVIFHEITEEAIKKAFSHPEDIDINKVEAQKARRVLDRIVGYFLSPFLWRKITKGLSAGRVQSVALRFIVEREKAIREFKSVKSYSIEALFKIKEKEFLSKLVSFKGKKVEALKKEEAEKIREFLQDKAFFIESIEEKEVKRKPQPPFITSSLQQEAFSKLKFSAKKTMMLAQRLYEGMEIKGKMVGLITYMRTDSFSVAEKAKEEVKRFIQENMGKIFLASSEYRFPQKKGAQLAHEAIRPTDVFKTPDSLKEYLSEDLYKLYELIWRRFVASFMKESFYRIRKLKITTESREAQFLIEAKKCVFEGFEKMWDKEKAENIELFSVEKKDKVVLVKLALRQHVSKPPPRFNDASLVRILEEKGIGRPSTYAPTISTLIDRGYVRRERGALVPTELGMKVSQLLVENFSDVINEKFTAQMEEDLDKVEEGKVSWQKILENFYPSFKESIDRAIQKIKKEVLFTEKKCPLCGKRLVIRWSKRGKFLSCEGFPQCRYTESITTDVICPQCKEGKLVERRNKKGQIFYGCSRYPKCKYTTPKLPEKE